MSNILDVNLRGVYHGLELVIPELRAAGTGALVLVASVAGLVGLLNATVYGPTKAALDQSGRVAAQRFARRRCGCVPGQPRFRANATDGEERFPDAGNPDVEQAAAAILRGLAAGRFSVHFPKRFTGWLYLLRHPPDRIRLAIVRG